MLPAENRPYNSRYVAGAWRNHFDFHGGGILEWGSHTFDLVKNEFIRDEEANRMRARAKREPWRV